MSKNVANQIFFCLLYLKISKNDHFRPITTRVFKLCSKRISLSCSYYYTQRVDNFRLCRNGQESAVRLLCMSSRSIYSWGYHSFKQT